MLYEAKLEKTCFVRIELPPKHLRHFSFWYHASLLRLSLRNVFQEMSHKDANDARRKIIDLTPFCVPSFLYPSQRVKGDYLKWWSGKDPDL